MVAGALVRPGASAVEARVLAHRVFSLEADAPTAAGIVEESALAGAHVRPDAPAVRAAVVLAVRRRVGGGRRGDASAGVGVAPVPRHAGAAVVADANAVRAAAVPAIARLRRRTVRRRTGDASAGVGIDRVAVIALRLARHGKHASTVLVQRVARSAAAATGGDAVAADATTWTVRRSMVRCGRRASTLLVQRVARPAVALTGGDAIAADAATLTARDAGLVVVGKISVPATDSYR